MATEDVMQAVLDSIRRQLAQRRESAAADYHANVVAVADGRDFDPGLAIEALMLSGKSEEDFIADIEMILQRRAWLRDYQAWRDAAPRVSEIHQQIELLEKQKADSVAPLDAKIAELKQDLESLANLSAAGSLAESELRSTTPPALLEQIAMNGREVEQLEAQIDELKGRRSELERKSGDLSGMPLNDPQRQQAAAALNECCDALNAAITRRGKLQEEADELDSQRLTAV